MKIFINLSILKKFLEISTAYISYKMLLSHFLVYNNKN